MWDFKFLARKIITSSHKASLYPVNIDLDLRLTMADVVDRQVVLTQEDPPSPSGDPVAVPQAATPDEIPVNDRRQTTAAAEEAVMGATGDLDNVGGFEVYDESGELVKGLFYKFLLEL
jgi:hypothetical protein